MQRLLSPYFVQALVVAGLTAKVQSDTAGPDRNSVHSSGHVNQNFPLRDHAFLIYGHGDLYGHHMFEQVHVDGYWVHLEDLFRKFLFCFLQFLGKKHDRRVELRTYTNAFIMKAFQNLWVLSAAIYPYGYTFTHGLTFRLELTSRILYYPSKFIEKENLRF